MWLVDAARVDAASAFAIADHMARFDAVNEPHRRRATAEPLPATLATTRGRGGRVGVVDLHYQSSRTAPLVLDATLASQLAAHDEVWLITGTGHHTDRASHQRAVAGGVLHAATKEYLEEYGYAHHPAKDHNGHSGAFLVVRGGSGAR
jgi:hypothetical protein